MKKTAIRLAAILLILSIAPIRVNGVEALVPGGQVIGLKLEDNSVIVAALDLSMEGARKSGLQIGDEILTIDGRTIGSVADVRNALMRSGGQVEVTVRRKKSELTLTVYPHITSDGPKLGAYLKEGVSGIGTITWFDPDSGKFGTLGHGVHSATGELLNMVSGSAYPARVVSVKTGKIGVPGQLRGMIAGTVPLGTLSDNTSRGVFGTAAAGIRGEAIPVATQESIHTGAATILSTVSGDSVREYSVEILKLYPHAQSDGRNMLLRITDPQLLQVTGGIVQGMSGSPIIQDGKLIGAVTHVLVNDPTTGYGIFIENMLDAAG